MWIKVHVVTHLGTRSDEAESYVNFDHVRMLIKADKGCKIGMEDGSTFGLTESYERIVATLDGTLNKAYEAPNPKVGNEQ